MSLPSAVCLTGVRSAGVEIAGVGSGSARRRSSEARQSGFTASQDNLKLTTLLLLI